MVDDPFSDILKFTNAQSVVSGGFAAGGSWAVRFPAPDKIKFFGLVKGRCWLSMDGEEAPVRIEEGDVFLLSAQRSFVLSSDLAAVPIDATSLFGGGASKFAEIGDGEDCIQIGGHVRLDPASGGLLADILPPLIHVRASSPQATVLQWLLDQLVRERVADLPGASLASAQLAQLMFVQILRAHLAASGSFAAGWLRALGDPRIAPALRLMHGDPSRDWHLEELAHSVAMSRSTFSSRFREVAGVPPLTYLTNWRMRLAQRALREGNAPVSTLGLSLGYTSESAFSNAFKRAIGMAPKRFRDKARADGGSLQSAPAE
ncbi:AraC family transcriptional regulator [Rhizobium tubonense]|uniref:AraC family transcriptional regulator n=1 Tax=Rhizobium tubonense TaxID=484088 RepID=A0A2W4EHT1_9HYPH|nr:AraC family transcriptional regulator [Rhizobium tubonense]PZM13706.1 AraC family transcriptional regulator [Rhizobium tubonense]